MTLASVITWKRNCELEQNLLFLVRGNIFYTYGPLMDLVVRKHAQKHMNMERVTCNSFPWNKAGDFRTKTLCPNMDENKTEAAREGKFMSHFTSK